MARVHVPKADEGNLVRSFQAFPHPNPLPQAGEGISSFSRLREKVPEADEGMWSGLCPPKPACTLFLTKPSGKSINHLLLVEFSAYPQDMWISLWITVLDRYSKAHCCARELSLANL
jgi:hypothetical protein